MPVTTTQGNNQLQNHTLLFCLKGMNSGPFHFCQNAPTTRCFFRRESLEPGSHHGGHRHSRSSNDDDSDPCLSYPYMPLDSALLLATTSPASTNRRYSLPVLVTDPKLLRIGQSGGGGALAGTSEGRPLQHQLYRASGLERPRRSSFQHQTVSGVAAQRRRLFAQVPIQSIYYSDWSVYTVHR